MKTKSPHTLRIISARNRQQPSHARHIFMKSISETGNLWQIGERFLKFFDQQQLLRQMLRIKRLEAAKFLKHLGSNHRWAPVIRAAMHDSMTNCRQISSP